MKKITVVIPTYNERDNIKPLLEKLHDVYLQIKGTHELTILFIEDSSPDGTAEIIKQNISKSSSNKLASQEGRYNIKIIKRKGKLGLGSAYIKGFKVSIQAKQDFIIQMDADLSHDPMVIPEMIKTLENFDMVIGSRYIKGGKLPKWSLIRKLISKGGNFYSRFFLGFNINDYTGGFNGYKRQALETIHLDEIKSNGYSFQIEMKYRVKKAGFTFMEIPIEFHDRTYGISKFSSGIFIEAMWNTLKLVFS